MLEVQKIHFYQHQLHSKKVNYLNCVSDDEFDPEFPFDVKPFKQIEVSDLIRELDCRILLPRLKQRNLLTRRTTALEKDLRRYESNEWRLFIVSSKPTLHRAIVT